MSAKLTAMMMHRKIGRHVIAKTLDLGTRPPQCDSRLLQTLNKLLIRGVSNPYQKSTTFVAANTSSRISSRAGDDERMLLDLLGTCQVSK